MRSTSSATGPDQSIEARDCKTMGDGIVNVLSKWGGIMVFSTRADSIMASLVETAVSANWIPASSLGVLRGGVIFVRVQSANKKVKQIKMKYNFLFIEFLFLDLYIYD